MSTALDSLSHKVQRAAVGTMVDVALAHVNKDRQKAIAEMVDVAKQFYGDSFSEETYEHAHAVLADPDSKWSKLINCGEPDQVPLQHPVAHPLRPHFGLQYALCGLLGGRVRPQEQPQL